MSTARAPWHRLAGPSEAPETPCYCGAGPLSACPGDWNGRCGANAANGCVETPPRLYPAGCDQQGRRLTRHDSAEVAAAPSARPMGELIAEHRAQSDAEAIELEESTTHPADKVLAAMALVFLGGMVIGMAMPWIAPALLSWMGVV